MPRFKSLLKSNNLKKAGRKRKCYHDANHIILKGEWVLEVNEGMNKSYAYCAICALKMINDAQVKLWDFKEMIKNND